MCATLFQKIFSKTCMTFHCEAVIEIFDKTVSAERGDMGVEGNPHCAAKSRGCGSLCVSLTGRPAAPRRKTPKPWFECRLGAAQPNAGACLKKANDLDTTRPVGPPTRLGLWRPEFILSERRESPRKTAQYTALQSENYFSPISYLLNGGCYSRVMLRPACYSGPALGFVASEENP